MRDAILDAFERAGGVDYLVDVAQSSPEVFCRLLAKLLPTTVRADSDGATLEDLITASRQLEKDAGNGHEIGAAHSDSDARKLLGPTPAHEESVLRLLP